MINHRLRLAGVIISGLLALVITAVDLLFFFRGETAPLPALLPGLCALGISSIEAIVSRAQGRAFFRCTQRKFSVLLALPYTNA